MKLRGGCTTPGGVIPGEKTAQRVKALLEEHSASWLSALWGCGRELPVRIAARQRVRRGSLLLVEVGLRDMEMDVRHEAAMAKMRPAVPS